MIKLKLKILQNDYLKKSLAHHKIRTGVIRRSVLSPPKASMATHDKHAQFTDGN